MKLDSICINMNKLLSVFITTIFLCSCQTSQPLITANSNLLITEAHPIYIYQIMKYTYYFYGKTFIFGIDMMKFK